MTGQAAHAALFQRVARHLAVTAGKLSSLEGDVQLRPVDVGALFITTGFLTLATELDRAAAIVWLRNLADEFERGEPLVRN
jgi:predicted component of type VI protein secretion system